MALRLPPLNRESGTPVYEQLARHLTARKALRLVAERGYGRLQPGMGYYVPEELPGE